ncbi:MAG: 1-phosphofructokinase family hexose kinase [Clostridia bacterium]|nr:1-phosphofructokinase family hexose kinase [Clostridia bacterium]
MILTICPNPSIDCTIELDSLNVGKLNRIANKVETYSGKALNVAIGVARLNEECFTTGFMFEDHGRLFEHNLEKNGVSYDFVYNKGSARVNYKIIDKKSMLTEINDKGGEVSEKKQRELIEKVKVLSEKAEILVMSGSLPKGVSPEFYGEVLSVVPENVKVIIDAEKENALCALKTRKIFMVKPNLTELEKFSGEKAETLADMVRCSKKYMEAGAENVLISMGAEGAVYTDGNESFYCKSASVAVNSTVGAGDSMIAAACVALKHGKGKAELLKMSVAAGTAAVTTSGTNLFYKDKYDEIYSKIFVERL